MGERVTDNDFGDQCLHSIVVFNSVLGSGRSMH